MTVETRPWTCPRCHRDFKVAIDRDYEICPDCEAELTESELQVAADAAKQLSVDADSTAALLKNLSMILCGVFIAIAIAHVIVLVNGFEKAKVAKMEYPVFPGLITAVVYVLLGFVTWAFFGALAMIVKLLNRATH